MRVAVAALVLTALTMAWALPAQARHHHQYARTKCVGGYCAIVAAQPRTRARERVAAPRHPRATRLAQAAQRGALAGGEAAQIVSHPAGCPRRLFCGCGAALRVFGTPVRALWLAANWFHFPRAAPAPGMAAVRRHHVFVIEQVLSAGRVLAYDANSGRGLTRIHVRSLVGYTVVNPRGGRA